MTAKCIPIIGMKWWAFTEAFHRGFTSLNWPDSTAATVVNLMMRQFSKAFMVAHTAIVDNSTYIYDFPFPMTLLQKTDVYATIEAGSGKTAVNFEFLLVKN